MIRRITQFLLLGFFVYLVSKADWKLSTIAPVDAFLKIDPLLSLQAAIALREWVPALAYGLLLVALTFVLGRFFCGWICPTGTLIEYGDDIIFRKRKKRLFKNGERKLRGLKYGFLAIVLIAALFGQTLSYLFDPISWITRLFSYAVWPAIAIVGNFALDITRPALEALGWFNLARMELDEPRFTFLGWVSILFFFFILWINRYQRRFWCRSLCPLGALLALSARFSLFRRKVGSACDDDGACGRKCETGAIPTQYREYDPGECIQCGRCVEACHQKTVEFKPSLSSEAMKPSFDLSRRRFIGWLGAGVVAGGALKTSSLLENSAHDFIRPPGALPEEDFLAACIRCGKCVKACPTNCLQPSLTQAGVSGLITPLAQMRIGACDQNCNACGRVCPTGAIRSLSFEEKRYARMGIAAIDEKKCIVFEKGRACLVCDENCPYGAIYWKENEKGDRRPYVDDKRCNGCGQCEVACPIEGVSAIIIKPKGEIRLKSGSYIETGKAQGMDLSAPREDTPYWEM